MKSYELKYFCEFDTYAAKSYSAIHGVDESKNLGDITEADETKLEPFTMIVGGSPCQDFSVAGKQKGSVWKCQKCNHEYNPLTVHWSKRDKCSECQSTELDKSRSSLLVEWLRIIRANKPNFGIYENVKNIVGKQFKETTFKIFETELHEYGYNTYWKVLNAKDHGIPQNRERVYLILVKKELDNGKFRFPKEYDSGIRLKDVLDTEVDEKYYIANDKLDRFITDLNSKNSLMYDSCQVKREGKSREYNDYSPTLTSRDYKDPRLVNDNVIQQLGNYRESSGNFTNPQTGRVYSVDGISPTINTMQGGDRQPKILEVNDGIIKLFDIPKDVINDNERQRRVYSNEGIAPTVLARTDNAKILENEEKIRIRKLTPKECFRLMGFSDEDFDKAKAAGISDSQLYKQSGNSIVVNVLFEILVELHKAMPYLFDDLTLGSFFSGIGAFEKALDRLHEYINTGVNSVNFTQPQVV